MQSNLARLPIRPAHRMLGAVALLALTCLLGGCGSSHGGKAKTVTRTVDAKDAGAATTTTATTATATTTTTAAKTTATTPTTPATAPTPPSAHPTSAPTNLTATPAMKAQLLAAVQQLGATESSFRHSKIAGPDAGTTYYAGLGDYEYAQAIFSAPGSLGSDVGAPFGTAWRKVGGPWTAIDLGNYSDISPQCLLPDSLNRRWNAQAPANPCSAKWTRSIRQFADVSNTFRCEAEDSGDGADYSFVTCGAFTPGGGIADVNATLLKQHPGEPAGDALSIAATPLERLPYGIVTPIVMRSATFMCTMDPDHVRCVAPSGHWINITHKAATEG